MDGRTDGLYIRVASGRLISHACASLTKATSWLDGWMKKKKIKGSAAFLVSSLKCFLVRCRPPPLAQSVGKRGA